MIFEFLKMLLKECEYLKNFDIRCEKLAKKEQSVSIAPTGKTFVIKEYSDGEKVIGTECDVVIRLKMVEDNGVNYEFLDKLMTWINNLRLNDYQEISNKYLKTAVPVEIMATSGVYLFEDDIYSGKYKIQLRIDCLV